MASTPLWILPVVIFPLLAACTKTGSDEPNPSSAAPAEAPRRNSAEALGFASGASEDYMQNRPAQPQPQSPPPPSAPAQVSAPKATASVSSKTIKRTLTATDGRKLEAVLLARSADAVTVRRTADGTEFVIPFEKLSEADRAFIRESALPVLASGH